MIPSQSSLTSWGRNYLVLYLAIVVVSSLLLGYFLLETHRQTEHEAEAGVLNVATSVGSRVDSTLRRIESALAMISHALEGLPAEGPDAHQKAHINVTLHAMSSQFPELMTFRVFDRQGDLLYSGDDTPAMNIAEREHFQRLRAQPELGLYFSDSLRSKKDQRLVLVVAKAVIDDGGRFQGLITAPIDLDYFVRLFTELDVGQHGIISIRRADSSRLVVRRPEVAEEINQPASETPPFEQIQSGRRQGLVRYPGHVDQVDRYFAYYRVGNYPFYILAGKAVSEHFAPWRLHVLLAVGVMLATSLLLGYFLWRMWQGHAGRAESESRFRTLASITSDLIYSCRRGDDGIFRVEWMGGDAEPLFGCDTAKILALGCWRPFVAPEDAEAFDRNVTNLQPGQSSKAEMTILRADGLIAFAQSVARVEDDPTGGGRHRLYGALQNITDRKQAQRELETYRDQLEALVKTRTAELQVAKEAAEAASRAKGAFLANMSHELRTPLNAVLGLSQLMERNPLIPEQELANLRTINRSGQHLLSLINDVLEISRIEAGRQSLQLSTLDLRSVLNLLAESMTLVARQKGVDLRFEIAEALPRFIDSDVGKLRQILLNLLSNALKFTDQGEVVLTAGVLSAAGHQATLRIRVRDSGTGIAPDDLERIFDPFYQAEAGAKSGKGTGLGLAISRNYAQLLGGQLTVASTLGQGSAFTLTLPVEVLHKEEPEAPPRRVLRLAPGQPDWRILIAEDEPVNQALLRMWLEEVGFTVRVADNGRQALELFQSWRPQFIWMDMRMPEMDGFEATRAIRGLPEGRDIPIVAFTASAFDEERQAIFAAGCDDVMTKPMEEGRLFSLMAKYLPVEFSYEGEQQPAQAPPDAAELPQDIRARLSEAAVLLDLDAVRQISAELQATHPNLAARIGALADCYDFESIGALIK